MRVPALFATAALALTLASRSSAQTANLRIAGTDSVFCAGDSITLSLRPGLGARPFHVVISDCFGRFLPPIKIDSFGATADTAITVALPQLPFQGAGFRLGIMRGDTLYADSSTAIELRNPFAIAYDTAEVRYGGRFMDSHYFASRRSVRWDTAMRRAQRMGGYLVSVQSQAENNYVRSLIPTAARISIGAQDTAIEGRFVHLSGERVRYTNWRPNEPNNSNGGEDMVEIYPDGGWNDERLNRDNRYVMEVPAGRVISTGPICVGDTLGIGLPPSAQLPPGYSLAGPGVADTTGMATLTNASNLNSGLYTVTAADSLCRIVVPLTVDVYGSGTIDTLLFKNIGSYNGRRRYITAKEYSYVAGSGVARAICGTLATVRDSADQMRIYMGYFSAFPGVSQLYIGLTDEAVEGDFVWDSGDTTRYRNWSPGEPNNSNNEDGTTMRLSDGKWNDVNSGTAFQAIVETRSTGRIVTIPDSMCSRTGITIPISYELEGEFDSTHALVFQVGPYTDTVRNAGRSGYLFFNAPNLAASAGGYVVRMESSLLGLIDSARIMLGAGSPPAGLVVQRGDTLVYTGSATGKRFVWYIDTLPVAGANGPEFKVPSGIRRVATGYYSADGCYEHLGETIVAARPGAPLLGRLIIRPNPAQNRFMAQLAGGIRYELITATGRLVAQGSTGIFDVSNVPRGLYLVKAYTQTGSAIGRVVIQ